MNGRELLAAWLAARPKLTLESVGKRLGVGKVAVWFWLHGWHKPTAERRRAISRLTGGAVPIASWDVEPVEPEADAA